MKALNLIFQLMISASLLIVSQGIAEEPCLTSTINILDRTSWAQTRFSAPNSIEADKQLTRDTPVADISLSHSVSAISFEQPILSDPYINQQWALSQIQVPRLWQITTGNPEILVAVLDTGIDQNHEDLNGKVAVEVNLTDSLTLGDVHGHGTHIAGIIAANSNNGVGIVGVAPGSQLMNVKVADDKGRCQASAVAKGIIWAVDNGASVLNVSVELEEPSLELEDAINYAWSQGAVIITAAGNQGSQLPVYPAYYENCIAVAATRQDDTLAPLSNHGDWVDVGAPGFNIYSSLPDNNYGYKSGTSFATAHVSGLAALLFCVVADTNGDGRLNDEVREAIETGCQQVSINSLGQGRIDAATTLAKIGHTP